MKTSTTRATKPAPKRLQKLAVAAVWLLLWQGAYLLIGEDLLLVSPLSVFLRILELGARGAFWRTIASSFGRIALGFCLGVALGSGIAVLTAFSPLLYTFFYIPMGMIKATPVASFVILALVWVKGANLSVFIALLMVLPLIWANVHQGLVETDPQLLEMAAVYRLGWVARARNIYLPSVLPYLLSAVRVSLGFAWKSGIAGEVLAIPAGSIGRMLYDAKIYLETVDLFAWTAVIIALSILIERVMVAVIGRAVGRLNRLSTPEEVPL